MHARRTTSSRDAMAPTGLAVSWDLDPPISLPRMHCIVPAVTVTCSKYRLFFSRPDRATVPSRERPQAGYPLTTSFDIPFDVPLDVPLSQLHCPTAAHQFAAMPPARRPSPCTHSCADFQPTASAGSHPPAMHHYFLLLSLLSLLPLLPVRLQL